MKRRNQRGNTLAAGIAGMAVVFGLSIALNFVAFRGQGVAEEQQPILQIEQTTTPVPPPIPASAPAVGDSVLAESNFTAPAALDAWEFVDVGVMLDQERSVWQVVDGALLQNRTAAAGNPMLYDTMALTGDPSWSNYTISTRFYDEGNGVAGLIARRDGESYYRLSMLGEPFNDTPTLLLEKVVDGQETTVAAADLPAYKLYTWHTLSLSVNGSQISAAFNGKPVLTAEDSTLSSGQAGLYTIARGLIRFADVVVSGVAGQ